MSTFYNPYAFVPAPARPATAPSPFQPSHGVLLPDRWTGKIRIRMTAITPLLITEQNIKNPKRSPTDANKSPEEVLAVTERKTRTVGDRVVLPPTSVKGMIRAEYEMVTNSRYGVFHEHDDRLGYRDSASGQDLMPVRVVQLGDEKKLLPLRGMQPAKMRPAWVPRYSADKVAEFPNGTSVWAWVVLDGSGQFAHWTVRHMVRDALTGPPAPPTGVPASARLVRGWYFHSNKNIKRKKYERLFFAEELAAIEGDMDAAYTSRPSVWSRLPELPDNVAKGWRQLMESYHQAHPAAAIHARHWPAGTPKAGEEAEPTDYLGDDPGQTAWSWHLIPQDDELEKLKDLPAGTLCYAAMSEDKRTVTELFPVAISRRLYDCSPQELAEAANLAPATTHDELSPADLLFGWVPPRRREHVPSEKTRAIRGRLRFGPVWTEAAVEKVGRGLAVLERPRPTQDLFYAAQDRDGRPLSESERGYRRDQGLRGRKVYPHQPDTDWNPGQDGQPWLLHGTGLDENHKPDIGRQNALLKDWVPPGAMFECDLRLENLTDAELGSLLYVLRGRDGQAWHKRYHKLGGGKPLGFGSVTIEVRAVDVRSGDGWRQDFALDEGGADAGRIDQGTVDTLVGVFAGSSQFANYEAFLSGFPSGKPVHYPADPAQPESDVDRYEWFVQNRNGHKDRERDGRVRSLGMMSATYESVALPTDPTRPKLPKKANGTWRR